MRGLSLKCAINFKKVKNEFALRHPEALLKIPSHTKEETSFIDNMRRINLIHSLEMLAFERSFQKNIKEMSK